MSKTTNVCWFLLGISEYQLITEAVFTLVEAGFMSYCSVNVLEYLLANASDFSLCWINKSACGPVFEVVFMVF